MKNRILELVHDTKVIALLKKENLELPEEKQIELYDQLLDNPAAQLTKFLNKRRKEDILAEIQKMITEAPVHDPEARKQVLALQQKGITATRKRPSRYQR